MENSKESTTKLQLGCYIVQKAKIRYHWLIYLKAKIMSECGLILLKMLKTGTVKIWLGSYNVHKEKVRYVTGVKLFKMLN